MRASWTAAFLLCISALGSSFAQTDDESCNRRLVHADSLVRSGHYADAVRSLDSLLHECPALPPALWLRGDCCMRLGHIDSAVVFWERCRVAAPENWRILPDLIQAYQKLGDTLARDDRRGILLHMFAVGGDTSLTSLREFARDYFMVDSTGVEVYEQFKPTGDRQIFIVFVCFDPHGGQRGYYSLGSYTLDNEIAKEQKLIGPGERMYHLDYYARNYHATLMMFKGMPSYDFLRSLVVRSLNGELQPAASSHSVK